MNSSLFSGLTINIGILLALAFIYDAIMLNLTIDHLYKRIVAGIVIGSGGITVMVNTIPFMEGIVFDSHSILLSTTHAQFEL